MTTYYWQRWIDPKAYGCGKLPALNATTQVLQFVRAGEGALRTASAPKRNPAVCRSESQARNTVPSNRCFLCKVIGQPLSGTNIVGSFMLCLKA